MLNLYASIPKNLGYKKYTLKYERQALLVVHFRETMHEVMVEEEPEGGIPPEVCNNREFMARVLLD